MELTQCSETSVHKNSDAGESPKRKTTTNVFLFIPLGRWPYKGRNVLNCNWTSKYYCTFFGSNIIFIQ